MTECLERTSLEFLRRRAAGRAAAGGADGRGGGPPRKKRTLLALALVLAAGPASANRFVAGQDRASADTCVPLD
jgi:hypothetical protein